MLAGFIIHIYEGTAAQPGTFQAMTNGTVTKDGPGRIIPRGIEQSRDEIHGKPTEREKRQQAERLRAMNEWESEQDDREKVFPDSVT